MLNVHLIQYAKLNASMKLYKGSCRFEARAQALSSMRVQGLGFRLGDGMSYSLSTLRFMV